MIKKQRVLILKGLPASGKSTYAKELIQKEPGVWKRINKDDLRAMIDAGKWSKDNEEFVLKMRDQMMTAALEGGFSVIIDDTNLSPKHEKRIKDVRSWMPAYRDIEVEVKFFDVPWRDCVDRDASRPNPVGKKVIRKMYYQFLKPEPVKHKPGLPVVVICDIDGTIALHDGRSPYETEKCETDLPNMPVMDILFTYAQDTNVSTNIILVTGREDQFRDQTERWLSRYKVPYQVLHMRPTGDHREDSIVKKEIYEREIKDRYNVQFVLDDRRRVVDMWREQGLTVLQVDDGEF